MCVHVCMCVCVCGGGGEIKRGTVWMCACVCVHVWMGRDAWMWLWLWRDRMNSKVHTSSHPLFESYHPQQTSWLARTHGWWLSSFSLKTNRAEGIETTLYNSLYLFWGLEIDHCCCCAFLSMQCLTGCVESAYICISLLYSRLSWRAWKMSNGFPTLSFLLSSIKFWNIPNPVDRTKHNNATYYSII